MTSVRHNMLTLNNWLTSIRLQSLLSEGKKTKLDCHSCQCDGCDSPHLSSAWPSI